MSENLDIAAVAGAHDAPAGSAESAPETKPAPETGPAAAPTGPASESAPETKPAAPEAKPADAPKPADAAPDPEGKGEGKDETAGLWAGFEAHLPEGAEAEIVASYVEEAKAQGLSPDQARALMDWQLKSIAESQARLQEAGQKELIALYGREADARRQEALELIGQIDRKTDGAFSKAIGQSGLQFAPGFVRGMIELAAMTREDSLGASTQHAPAARPETPLEALEGIFGRK